MGGPAAYGMASEAPAVVTMASEGVAGLSSDRSPCWQWAAHRAGSGSATPSPQHGASSATMAAMAIASSPGQA